MKQIILFFLAVTVTAISYSQSIKMENDTIYYQNQKFYKGQEVKLAYGSGTDKKFVFVFWGTGLGGYAALPASMAKSTVVISKVYKAQGKYGVQGKLKDVSTMGAKVIIIIEGAVDNKELLIE